MFDFYIDGKSEKELSSLFCKDIDSKIEQSVAKMIIGRCYDILEHNLKIGDIVQQYEAGDKILEILEYSEEEFINNKHGLNPESHFFTINCFADALNAKSIVQNKMKYNYPEFTTEDQEVAFLNKVSKVTKTSVKNLIDLYRKENNAEYESAINKNKNSEIEIDIQRPEASMQTYGSRGILSTKRIKNAISWQERVQIKEFSSKASDDLEYANDEDLEYDEPLKGNER